MDEETRKYKFRKESHQKDDYFVAVKLLLRKGDELLITHDDFGDWDIPGGRIRKDQFDTPLEQILKDKIVEELGGDTKYKLGSIKTTFRIERKEAGRDNQTVRIFGIGYEAEFLAGDIVLGEYHDKYEWINLRNVDLSEYSSPGGWVEKLADYQKQVRGE